MDGSTASSYGMRMRNIRHTLAVALILVLAGAAHAETPEEWITLGARVHGAFGPFIPVGIRIGLDALDKLKPEAPRDLSVTYFNGTKPPCPCVADGVMLATHTSPGQGTLTVSQDKAPDGMMAVIVATNKKTGETVRYSIGDEWLPRILAWVKMDTRGRYDAAMTAEGLFQIQR